MKLVGIQSSVTSSPHRWGILAVALVCSVLLPACIIEREEEDAGSADVVEEVRVPPYSEPLRIVATFPFDGTRGIPTNASVWIQFDQHLDMDASTLSGSLRLRSGGANAALRLQYHMSRKRIVGQLPRPLHPGLVYELTVRPGKLWGVGGTPLLEQQSFFFETADGTDAIDFPIVDDVHFVEDITPVLDRSCGCHRLDTYPDPWFPIPALLYDRIVRQPSEQIPETMLIDPVRPHASYVMHKILPDYPVRVGTSMPPPWAGETQLSPPCPAEPLTNVDLRLMEEWIRAGANP